MTTYEELASYTSRVSPEQRRKRHLARDLPSTPGVYVFKDGQGRALYVGVSVDIRSRVSSYFTASEQRSRMAEMVRIAESVTPIVEFPDGPRQRMTDILQDNGFGDTPVLGTAAGHDAGMTCHLDV